MTDTATPDADGPVAEQDEYRVLARKYRPTNFDELIGQEALVRTLTNAIHSGRLAHAFILTGVRGVGKTTTARIIARALNCTGEDGTGGATPSPCGVCDNCKAIAEDRHVDVMEMDAASRTGVDDIREIIEGVRYKPTNARFKVYIIDEVHMLSKNAFNALLKTLEEPPEHVKFIFATTEIRKVPVTVLSRCQRFDLRRVNEETLSAHFSRIAKEENASVADGALGLISRAADGSVRDGLSLLDQAISHAAGDVAEEQVRDMLGLADRTQVFELLDSVMRGAIEDALGMMARFYDSGADPVVVLQDLLDLVHWLTRIKVTPAVADSPVIPEAERVQGREMAEKLSMSAISRAWQMLLKGLGEVRQAPSPLQAAEMVLVRLAYASELPTPEEAVKAAMSGTGTPAPTATPTPSGASGGAGVPPGGADAVASSGPPPAGPPPHDQPRAMAVGDSGPPPQHAPMSDYAPQPDMPPAEAAPWAEQSAPVDPDPATFQAVVDLAQERRAAILHANLFSNFHLVRFEPGRIEFHPGDLAPQELAHDLSKFLNENTSRRWVVTVSRDPGQSTLQQQEDEKKAQARVQAAADPLVKAVLEAFPGAEIENVEE